MGVVFFGGLNLHNSAVSEVLLLDIFGKDTTYEERVREEADAYISSYAASTGGKNPSSAQIALNRVRQFAGSVVRSMEELSNIIED